MAARQRRENTSCVWKTREQRRKGAIRFADVVLLINRYSLPEIRLDVNRPIPSMSTRSNAIERARAVSHFLFVPFIAAAFPPRNNLVTHDSVRLKILFSGESLLFLGTIARPRLRLANSNVRTKISRNNRTRVNASHLDLRLIRDR